MYKKNSQSSSYLPKSTHTGTESIWLNYLLSAVIGFAVFLVCYFALILLGSALLLKLPDPSRLIPIVATVSMTIASMVGSIVSAKKSSGNKLISSLMLLSLITLVVLLMTVTHLKESSGVPLIQDLLLKVPVILGVFFGGYIGSLKKKPKSLYAKYK